MSSFAYDIEIAAPPAEVRRLLPDEAFLTAGRSGSTRSPPRSPAARTRRACCGSSTTRIPSGFRPMVGDTVTVPVETAWEPEHDGTFTVRLRTQVRATKSAEAAATMMLRPAGGKATAMTIRGVLKVHGGGIAAGVIEAGTKLVIAPCSRSSAICSPSTCGSLPAPDPPRDLHRIRPPHTRTRPTVDDMSSRRILVVDDDATIGETIAARLRAEGFAVQTAGDGPGAVEAARAGDPEIVVFDVMLPAFDGLQAETCRSRQKPAAPGL